MMASIRHSAAALTGRASFDREYGWAIGWVAHDGHSNPAMPVWSSGREIALFLAGDPLIEPSRRVNAGDAAAALIQDYQSKGEGLCRRLQGSFSGVLIDQRGGRIRILLFNDRYGLERIYYHEDENAFYFASEAKALLKVVPALRQLDPDSLAEYVLCGSPLQDRSLFRGIQLLPRGSAWVWQPETGLSRGRYFDPSEWEGQSPLSPEEFYRQLKDVFTRIAPAYAAADRPVALSITGGVDSRMILAALRPQPGAVPCYTFGGMYRECADVAIGRALARASKQPHQSLVLTPGFFSEFGDLATRCVYLTDGAMDVRGAANLFLNRLAHDIAPLRLTGNYGGEILRGITALKVQAVDETIFDPGLASNLRRVPTTLVAERSGHPASYIAFKEVAWHHFAMLALERSQVAVRTPFLDHELVALSYRAPREFHLNKNPAFRFIHDLDPRLSAIPTDRGSVWSPDTALEIRRSRWRRLREEFLPRAEYAFDYGMPDWLARTDRVLSPLHLERLFLGHQKFAHFRLWYRRELSGFVRDILLDHRTLSRPFLNRRRVEQVVTAHTRGTANHTLALHKLLSCELLHRTLLDAN
jgi:asparagine synthase (glutamine-hydrolysing)